MIPFKITLGYLSRFLLFLGCVFSTRSSFNSFEFSRLFHCSVIKVLCCSLWQLLHFITVFCVCQELFYLFFEVLFHFSYSFSKLPQNSLFVNKFFYFSTYCLLFCRFSTASEVYHFFLLLSRYFLKFFNFSNYIFL